MPCCGRQAAEPQDLGTLGGALSAAYGVNNAGQVVGRSRPLGAPTDHAFVWQGGTMRDLNELVDQPLAPGTILEQAAAINDSGLIVGWTCTADCPRGIPPSHAYLLVPHGNGGGAARARSRRTGGR